MIVVIITFSLRGGQETDPYIILYHGFREKYTLPLKKSGYLGNGHGPAVLLYVYNMPVPRY